MAVNEDAKESPKVEAETGFGTGLRGKPKKRQEPDRGGPRPRRTVPGPSRRSTCSRVSRSPPSRRLLPPSASPVAAAASIAEAELDALRAELAAALDRERDLRIELGQPRSRS